MYIYFGTHITAQKHYPESKWQKNPVEASAVWLSTLRCSKATFISSWKPEQPLPQIDSRPSNWIHFIVKKFSRLQFTWQSQSCLVGERVGELEGGGGWRGQDEATWDVTCDQAVFLPFFLPHSLQTIPDPRVLEVGLTSLTKRSNYFPTKHFVYATLIT